MWEWAKPWYCTLYSSPATSCPLNRETLSVCWKGFVFTESCVLFSASAIDTDTPSVASPSAARRFAGVMRFSVPSSSSSPPASPVGDLLHPGVELGAGDGFRYLGTGGNHHRGCDQEKRDSHGQCQAHATEPPSQVMVSPTV